MRFWDTSALIPLMLREKRSDTVRLLLEIDADVVTSAVTPIEVASVIWRQRHAGELTAVAHQLADVTFADLSTRWREVAHSRRLVDSALDVLSRHP